MKLPPCGAVVFYINGTLGIVLDEITYLYGNESWGDLLTNYDGNTITYDTIGNPLSDGTWTYTWEQGRQLTKMQSSSVTWNYNYNSDGLRIGRTNGTDTYTYWYDGNGRLLRMKYNDIVMSFSYSASGQPMSITYNGVVYYYLLNAQGDVVGLIDSTGNLVVQYTYDAWGRHLSITYPTDDTTSSQHSAIGANNPLRYRSYIYDTETGLYYLQSRYYNPTWDRFINADGQLSGVGGNIIGYNQFAYCFNNPVNRVDDTGTWPKWLSTAADWFFRKVVIPVNKVISDIAEDIRNFDSFNQDEDKVLSANYFSCYKGKLVIMTPFDASFSFGIIGLSREQLDETTLRHEYGHTQQLEQKGVVNYISKVAIPSIMINILDRKEKLIYDYYGAPWEAEADRLGGVNRTENNTPWPEEACDSLWDIIILFF